ncbi:MAG: hypothetical protein ACFCUJ_04090 [Thiotrichales bacterium]
MNTHDPAVRPSLTAALAVRRIGTWSFTVPSAMLLLGAAFGAIPETVEIPLDAASWRILAYSNRPANELRFGDGMTINVSGSASPVVYALPSPLRVGTVHLRATIDGDVALDGRVQGGPGADDFLLRLGLVYEGEQRLGFVQRRLAAPWVRELHALAPPDTGISRVEFLNIHSDPRIAGLQRDHPLASILKERFILERPADGRIDVSFPVPTDARVLAVWLSADGDDTGSAFSVTLHRIAVSP